MNWIKELKSKTWIDWIKIVVAIDIASAGLGLVMGINFHVFTEVFGFISRLFFGVMYIFIAVLMLKRVFPVVFGNSEGGKKGEENIDIDIRKGFKEGKRLSKKFIKGIEYYSEKAIVMIDNLLDRIESFFHAKKNEVKDEIENLVNKK